MSSSKLQSCLVLCWFIQAFLKLVLQNRKRVPYRISNGVLFMTFVEQDGILLEIHNRNDEICVWRLVATTSPNLAVISLP
jgi:hypothetical protein